MLRKSQSANIPAWRDDIAAPVGDVRLGEILLDPRDAFSRPEWLARHVCLSPDEKRVALFSWLRQLLGDTPDGAGESTAVMAALAELAILDPGAAGVLRRAFVARGFVFTA